ncbi:alpha/beta hydrolase family protein [Variovorax paradoxus]|uniref:alpha/beta hydrolase family protein n=1 Tax=Variovorax paradoxus TaxID=34073 RepID=UPI00278158CD|nr:CocE/NonD family hydrolase [Variovorax paradoxus]MDQ0586281.1 dienelactone hydrolase [Variovorax paradoxus]
MALAAPSNTDKVSDSRHKTSPSFYPHPHLPKQGAALRQRAVAQRADVEIPVARCIDWLCARSDMDSARIALYGASLGGIGAARAASAERRLKAVVSDSLISDLHAGFIEKIRCPYLIVQGKHDLLGLQTALDAVECARQHGVAVALKIFTAEETGASHCQADIPSLGQAFICDWLTAQLADGT